MKKLLISLVILACSMGYVYAQTGNYGRYSRGYDYHNDWSWTHRRPSVPYSAWDSRFHYGAPDQRRITNEAIQQGFNRNLQRGMETQRQLEAQQQRLNAPSFYD